MLAPIKHLLPTKRIILASNSERRQQILELIGLNVEIIPSTFIENLQPGDYEDYGQFVAATALGKAEEVYNRLKNGDNSEQLLVIAADTMVTMGSEIFGKPKDAADATRMLKTFSGKSNRVYTGVVLKHSKGTCSFTEMADVHFGTLNRQQIKDYVDSGDPLDKAGGYGISGPGGALISRIEGDFYCVMGLPLHRFCCELIKIFLEE